MPCNALALLAQGAYCLIVQGLSMRLLLGLFAFALATPSVAAIPPLFLRCKGTTTVAEVDGSKAQTSSFDSFFRISGGIVWARIPDTGEWRDECKTWGRCTITHHIFRVSSDSREFTIYRESGELHEHMGSGAQGLLMTSVGTCESTGDPASSPRRF